MSVVRITAFSLSFGKLFTSIFLSARSMQSNRDHNCRSMQDWRGCDSGCPVAKTYYSNPRNYAFIHHFMQV